MPFPDFFLSQFKLLVGFGIHENELFALLVQVLHLFFFNRRVRYLFPAVQGLVGNGT